MKALILMDILQDYCYVEGGFHDTDFQGLINPNHLLFEYSTYLCKEHAVLEQVIHEELNTVYKVKV